MATKVSFSYEDAVDALIKFHCLPDNVRVTIEPDLGPLVSYNTLLNELVSIGTSRTENKWENKIATIKKLREKTGIGLKEAKSVANELWVNTTPATVQACDLKTELDRYIVTL